MLRIKFLQLNLLLFVATGVCLAGHSTFYAGSWLFGIGYEGYLLGDASINGVSELETQYNNTFKFASNQGKPLFSINYVLESKQNFYELGYTLRFLKTFHTKKIAINITTAGHDPIITKFSTLPESSINVIYGHNFDDKLSLLLGVSLLNTKAQISYLNEVSRQSRRTSRLMWGVAPSIGAQVRYNSLLWRCQYCYKIYPKFATGNISQEVHALVAVTNPTINFVQDMKAHCLNFSVLYKF